MLYLYVFKNSPFHKKKPFNIEYNFEELIAEHPPLKPLVFENKHGNKTVKFADHEAVKALNAALLKAHYSIVDWHIPKDIHLLDIGTGANLIYPILATRHFNWQRTLPK